MFLKNDDFVPLMSKWGDTIIIERSFEVHDLLQIFLSTIVNNVRSTISIEFDVNAATQENKARKRYLQI